MAHRNTDCDVTLQHLDARMLIWNIRRRVDRLQLQERKSVIQFILYDLPNETSNYWLLANRGKRPTSATPTTSSTSTSTSGPICAP